MIINRPVKTFEVIHKKTGKKLFVDAKTYNEELHQIPRKMDKKEDEKKVVVIHDKDQADLVESLLSGADEVVRSPEPKKKPVKKFKKAKKKGK